MPNLIGIGFVYRRFSCTFIAISGRNAHHQDFKLTTIFFCDRRGGDRERENV